MKPVELKPGLFWVGAIDWAIRDFHGYITPKGSTYNNYLILDDEPVLVDAVKTDFIDTSIQSISSLADFSRIRHMVVNHIEPDHGGGLARLMELMPGIPIYCTQKAKQGLERFHDTSKWNFKIVKTGDTLKAGKRTLLFIETPMIHWPDSMMTYVKEDRVLISQDGFGQHLASTQRFDDEFVLCASEAELEDAVWDYYANILMPFGAVIKNKLAELDKLGLEIDMIAPDHGIIWRKDPGRVIRMYRDMIEGRCDERVVIVYDTMWGGTGKMAQPLMQGIIDEGIDCRVIKLRATPTSIAIKEFWRARACLVGSPTLNNTIYPYVGQFLMYLKGLRPRNRMAGAFGTYGWAGGAVKEILEYFREMKLDIYEENIQTNYKPSMPEQNNAYDFGRKFAQTVREYHKKFQ